jgi:hypothetical protein
MQIAQFIGSIADHYRMDWSRIGHFLHDALMLCLRQGFVFKALTLLIAVCAILIVGRILRLYLTKAKALGMSSKELTRIQSELEARRADKPKSGRIRY